MQQHVFIRILLKVREGYLHFVVVIVFFVPIHQLGDAFLIRFSDAIFVVTSISTGGFGHHNYEYYYM